MPCINFPFPHLVAYDSNNPQLHMVYGATGVYARKGETFNYWYCQISCHNSFKCFNINQLMPPEVMAWIKNKEIFLVIDNGLEPFLSSANGIYQNLVIAENIPAEQIIFMSSAPTMIDHVKTLSAQLGEDMIQVEWFSMFEYQLYDVITNQIKEPLDTLQHKDYTKKFINFNRRWRLHRPLIVTLLHDRNLLDQGYVSLATSDFKQDSWKSRWAELLRYYNRHTEITKILNRAESVKSLPPMYLDTTDLVTNRAEQTHSTDEYYLNTYFSVVTETTYHTSPGYDGIPFLSEKVFKCIAMKHPFILVTSPHSLQYLKQLGYKTFESLIDESYDNELDDGNRMIKIVNEIERLCNLKDTELTNFLVESKKICSYNYNVLKNKNSFIRKM